MRPFALFHYDPNWEPWLYTPLRRAALARHLDLPATVCPQGQLVHQPDHLLSRIEILFSGWGATPLNAALLARLPRLKAVFYAAGDPTGLVADGSCHTRGIAISTANGELGRAVAEHTLGLIIIALKNVLPQVAACRHARSFHRSPGPGLHSGTVGLIGYGTVARQVRALLLPFGTHVLVYDPLISTGTFAQEKVHSASSLGELFARSDVISCHLPLSPETIGLCRGPHFAAMHNGATFINTARGGVIDEAGMLATFRARPDLTAFLDVLTEEPPPSNHAGYELPNVFLTPHIAGCLGPELCRLGDFSASEFERWRTGQPLLGRVGPAPSTAPSHAAPPTIDSASPLLAPPVDSASPLLVPAVGTAAQVAV
ncbi:MAG: hydroxyacid dehydrogenase [Burkholderiales bacterium]|nr:hydroxyacid dehydrogenase [Opitutaceae bacterium]